MEWELPTPFNFYIMFLKKKLKITKTNYLDIIPEKIKASVSEENGLVSVIIPKFESNFSKKYIVPRLKNPEFKYKLDEFGSETWLHIDGNNNVREIGEKLLEKFGEKIQPVFERLTVFLTQLYHNEIISFKEIKEDK